MARTEDGALLTAQHRQAQTQIRAQALQDYMRIWPLWTGDAASFDRLVAASVVVIRAHHRISSSIAAAYYDSFRRAEKPGGQPAPRLAAPIDPERVQASLIVTGREMTARAIIAGKSPQAAMQTALIRTSGSVTRQVLAGGRDTLVLSSIEDRQAVGWARVTAGQPCAFCLTMAARGAAYKSEGTARFQAHDHCVCSVAPVYADDPLPELRGARKTYDAAQRWARENPDSAAAGTTNDLLNNVRRYLARD